ncbi:MAG: FAD binding domain-containing protein [Myxococcota bacterium]
MKEGLVAPQKLIDVRQVPELRGIRSERDRLRIGAVTTLRDVAATLGAVVDAPVVLGAAAPYPYRARLAERVSVHRKPRVLLVVPTESV